MENLLSLAFDNLSSYDGPKIRKGLRQVEGLMANICLPKKQKLPKGKMSDTSSEEDEDARAPKSLSGLTEDPVFHEFFKLQEGFEWNLAHRLVTTLDRLIAKGGDGQNDLLILSALDLLQGVSLLHPPSRKIFGRESNMNVGVLSIHSTESRRHFCLFDQDTDACHVLNSCSWTSSSPTSAPRSSARRCASSTSRSWTTRRTRAPTRTSTACSP